MRAIIIIIINTLLIYYYYYDTVMKIKYCDIYIYIVIIIINKQKLLNTGSKQVVILDNK